MNKQKSSEKNTVSQNLTNRSLKEINESYASKIAKGEIEVTHNTNQQKKSAADQYNEVMKAKKIAQAEKQKKELEKRLTYLNKSIQSIREYNYSTARAASTQNHSSVKEKNQGQDQIKRKNQVKWKIKQYQLQIKKKKNLQKKKQLQAQQQALKLKQQQIEQQKIKRKQKICQSMQKIKKRVEDREVTIKKQEQQYKKIVQQKTLFHKLQQSFTQKQRGILQERKKKLADIRNLHRPISISQIAEHQKTFMEVLKQKQSLRERERRINNATENYRVSYKSPTYRRIAQGQKEPIEDQSRIKVDKMKQFAQHVKDKFMPQIDERKRELIQQIIESQIQKKRRQQIKEQNDRERIEEIRNKGLRYLQEVKDLPKKRNISQQQSPKSDRIQYKNYLTHSDNSGNKNWRNILESTTNKREKALKLQLEAEKFEASLRLKQQKVRLLKGDSEEIDQQYYDMIKAKLDLLEI